MICILLRPEDALHEHAHSITLLYHPLACFLFPVEFPVEFTLETSTDVIYQVVNV